MTPETLGTVGRYGHVRLPFPTAPLAVTTAAAATHLSRSSQPYLTPPQFKPREQARHRGITTGTGITPRTLLPGPTYRYFFPAARVLSERIIECTIYIVHTTYSRRLQLNTSTYTHTIQLEGQAEQVQESESRSRIMQDTAEHRVEHIPRAHTYPDCQDSYGTYST